MHSPHLIHFERNSDSGTDPGGRMSFSEGRMFVEVRPNKGTVANPSTDAEISFRREKSIGAGFAGVSSSGKLIAPEGHLAAQVKQ